MKSPIALLVLMLISGWVSGDQPVLLELYYESMCPDCQEFIAGQLYSTWKSLHKTGILSLKLYPYGNAHESKGPDGSWKFQCQHGQPECEGNMLEVCILKSVGFDVEKYLPTIYCMENTDDPLVNAEECLKKNLPQVSFDDVNACAKGKEGNALMHEMALKTEALDPSHEYVPWIVLNGVHTEDIQNEAQEHLLALVCDSYVGQKPKECENQKGGWFKWMRDLYNSVYVELVH